MEFNSVMFLNLFFSLAFISYLFIRKKMRNLWLLLLSFFFYYWTGMKELIIILVLVILNYVIGIIINRGKYKFIFYIGIITNVSFLIYCKYTNFFIENINNIFNKEIGVLNILVPIGISFIIFKLISYLVDVYSKKVEAEKNIIDFMLFVLFFPQVLSGPIVRYIDMKDELKFRYASILDLREGFIRFIIGLAKKVFIANNLGALVDNIWSISYYDLITPIAWLGAIAYTIQLYFDFSGYSDMAIGIARIFGFHFKENFEYPYKSKSITEFWRRWHISLSSWFRDYIYIPLGGSRTGNVYLNIFVVFLITGIWHGSSWTFVIWGLWNGLFNMFEKYINTKGYKIGTGSKIQLIVSWIYTIFVIQIGWIFFRSPDLSSALKYLKIMFGLHNNLGNGYTLFWYLDGFNMFILTLGIIFSVPYIKEIYNKYALKNNKLYIAFENSIIIILLIISMIGVVSSSYSSFIYFKF